MLYVIRFLIAVIIGTLYWGMLVIAVLVAGIATVYYGLTERDWKKEGWAGLIPLIKELFNDLGHYVFTGNF